MNNYYYNKSKTGLFKNKLNVVRLILINNNKY